MAHQTEQTDAGARLRAMRDETGLSQKRLAAGAGVSLSTVQRLERSGRGHNLKRVERHLEEVLAGKLKGKPDIASNNVSTHNVQLGISLEKVLDGTNRPAATRRFRVLFERASHEQRQAATAVFRDAYEELLPTVEDDDLLMELAVSIAAKTLARLLGDEVS